MLLAIDIGNTEVTMGLFDGTDLRRSFRVSSETRRTADEVELLLRQAFPELGDRKSRAIARAGAQGMAPLREDAQGHAAIVGSVVPAQTPIYLDAAKRMTLGEPLLVTAATTARVKIEYRDPESAGADRIANAAAIVVDFGTATTFDVLLKGRRYRGGVIAPGILTGAEHLVRRAARLSAFELKPPRRVVGRNTEESLQSGVFYGAVGQVDAIVRRIAAEEKIQPKVIATGGLAAAIAAHSETIQEVDPDLTLHGLRLIHHRHGPRHGQSHGRGHGPRKPKPRRQ
ncbi:MAG: type III pantothenate kinase [Candidatus Eisenbacteria bacterium]|uniref:Type III pantothenate kinase n=1 Tax=Eiseniibacteriota bacterium TaxID=2212470 RepID=A0A538TPU4_UNCEI|nr:MAG: type III pantothenate kinase [Candidatus Eisenbacteria bacterium]